MARRGWHVRLGASVGALVGMLALAHAGGAATFEPQAQPPTPQTGLVLGTVVDADSGRPVAGAVVTLAGQPTRVGVGLDPIPAGGRGPSAPRVMTNSEGRFLFTGLAAGRVSLNATKSGYLAGSPGRATFDGPSQPIILSAGERRGDVVIRMWRQGSISGVVTDELGEPAVAVRVNLLVPQFQSGRQTLRLANVAITDDRGVYRFSSLAPGSYYVAVPQTTAAAPLAVVERMRQEAERQQITVALQQSAGMTPQSGVIVGRQVLQMTGSEAWVKAAGTDGERLHVYRTVFHPNETGASRATPIEVGSGTDREGIDLQLRLVPAVSVSGALRGPDGPAPLVALRLKAVADDGLVIPGPGMDVATTISDAMGLFTFLGVPAGQYVIAATVMPRNVPLPPPPPPPPPGGGAGAIPVVPPPSPMGTTVSVGNSPPAMTGQLAISVDQRDIDGLEVVLSSGGRVSGRVEFEGGPERPAGEQLRRANLSFRLVDVDAAMGGQPNVGVQFGADGRFETSSLLPGRYVVSASRLPPNWIVKSVMISGRDATSMPFELTSADITGVVVTYTDQTTILNGQVTVPAGATDDPTWIFVFPADVAGWLGDGMIMERTRTMTAQPGGSFTVRDLPPGEYVAAASRRGPTNMATTDPTTHYTELARVGERVTLRVGLAATVRLSRVQEPR